MKCFLIIASTIFLVQNSIASSIKDYAYYEYDILFTNPVCEEYSYEQSVLSNDGALLVSKPKNVYCKKSDMELSANRQSSPHFQLLKLINDNDVNEIFLTYLSFSSDDVAKALCDGIENRNLKVTFIIDSKNEQRQSARKQLDYLATCRPKMLNSADTANIPVTLFRGNVGGLGFAHNKIIIARYASDRDKVKIVFSSGNMSSGTVLHHENWHFLTTSMRSYFAQAHYCVKEGMIQAAQTKGNYKKFIKECRSTIPTQPEEDITFYIVPSDGEEAMKRITKNFKNAAAIDGAAHRILHPEIINGLIDSAQQGKNVRFVVDDDIYWTGKRNVVTGSNNFQEFGNIMKMSKGGVNVRYMETNQNHKLLHHNKYLIFNFENGTGAVHTGAGNFTKSAFTNNFENYYFITIPEIVEAFRKQFEYKYSQLATSYEKMPKEYVNP